MKEFLKRLFISSTVSLLTSFVVTVAALYVTYGLPANAIEPCVPSPTVSPSPTPGALDVFPGQKIGDKIKTLKPGDVLTIHPGTYNEYIKATGINGTSDKHIVIRGLEGAIIKGNGDNGRLVEFSNSSYVDIFGLRFTNSDKLFYGINIQNFTFKNNEFDHSFGEAVRIKYLSNNNIIENNNLHDCGVGSFVFTDGSKNGECIYIGTAPEQLGDNPTKVRDTSSGNIVRNNVIVTNGNECVDIKEAATGNIVENNSCSGQKDPESGGMDSRGSGNTFRNNIIFNNVGAGIRVGGDKSTDGLNNNIYGNIITNNKGYAIKAMRWPQGKVCGNTHSGNKAFTNESRLKDIACI